MVQTACMETGSGHSRRVVVLSFIGALLFASLVTGLAALLTDYKWFSIPTLIFYLTVCAGTLAGPLGSRARRRREQQGEGE